VQARKDGVKVASAAVKDEKTVASAAQKFNSTTGTAGKRLDAGFGKSMGDAARNNLKGQVGLGGVKRKTGEDGKKTWDIDKKKVTKDLFSKGNSHYGNVKKAIDYDQGDDDDGKGTIQGNLDI
jgi:hypothetical protein